MGVAEELEFCGLEIGDLASVEDLLDSRESNLVESLAMISCFDGP